MEYIFQATCFSVPMSNSTLYQQEHLTDSRYRRVLPAWLSSMILHAILLVLLVFLVQSVPQGIVEEPDRTTGIVLKHTTNTGEYYEGENVDIDVASDSASSSGPADLVTALPSENDSPLDANSFLPDTRTGGGPAGGAVTGGGLNLNGTGIGTNNLDGGKVQTGVFGITGEGYKFVYVFDKSDSMNGYEGRPLAAAKGELLESLKSLGKLQQFQIIFYNEYENIFNPTLPGRLFFATEKNKQLAREFVRQITAEGTTRHLEPLLTAVDMAPDIIFFLTDGTNPKLHAEDLRRIERRNAGRAAINVIQFGTEQDGGGSWLKRLARENRGEYVFVNLRRFSPRELGKDK